ncbi:hypothetical protein SCB29_36455, partial [Paraburkholderia sp. SIMBA_055]
NYSVLLRFKPHCNFKVYKNYRITFLIGRPRRAYAVLMENVQLLSANAARPETARWTHGVELFLGEMT